MNRVSIIIIFLFAFSIPIMLFCMFNSYFAIKINISNSLSNKLFIVKKGVLPIKTNELVVFEAAGNDKYKKPFIKLVGGMEGDKVSRTKRDYFINDQFIGSAKEYSKDGKLATLGPVGVIPKNKYFVYTNNKDSYDSRYKEIGWIDRNDIIGVAYAIY